jgi:hypothetical protein
MTDIKVPAPEFTPEAIRRVLVAAFVAPYDPADSNPAGFAIRVPDLMDGIVVELQGVDLLEYGPGEWPSLLIAGYAKVLGDAGYSVRVVVNDVIVTAKEADHG